MKMRIFPLVLCAALAAPVTIVGCAMGNTSIANEDSTSMAKKLIVGKTTRNDVQAMFGAPMEKGTQNGREFWSYRTLQTSARTFIPFVGLATGSSGTDGKDLMIYFDKSGLVTSYDLSQSKG